MNPQTILYALTIIGGAALAVYTSYKQYQTHYENQHTYSYGGNRRKRRSTSFLCNRKSDDCIICFETMEVGQISTPDCGHKFHTECLTKWLKESKVCPFCRAKVMTA